MANTTFANEMDNPFTTLMDIIEERKAEAWYFKVPSVAALPMMDDAAKLALLQELQQMEKDQLSVYDHISSVLKQCGENPSLILEGDHLHPDFVKTLDFLRDIATSDDFILPFMQKDGADALSRFGDEFRYVRQQLIAKQFDRKPDDVSAARDMDSILSDMDEKLVGLNLISAKEHKETMMALMAVNPAYNNLVYDRLKSVIDRGIDSCKDDLKKLGIEVNDRDPKDVRGSVYELFSASANFMEVQMSRAAGFSSRAKGHLMPEAFKQVKSHMKGYGKGENEDGTYLDDMEAVSRYMDSLEAVSRKNKLADIRPTTFARGIAAYEAQHSRKPAGRHAQMQGMAREDYDKLYDVCVEYMMEHDSIPTFRGDKRKAHTASLIAGMLASRLDDLGLDMDQKHSAPVKEALLRSRDFRDAFTLTVEKEITKNCDMEYELKPQSLKRERKPRVLSM